MVVVTSQDAAKPRVGGEVSSSVDPAQYVATFIAVDITAGDGRITAVTMETGAPQRAEDDDSILQDGKRV